MNNKGQTLVLFVILIPFLFIIISFIVDIGLLSLEKTKLTNEIKDSIKYVLKNNKGTGDLVDLINKSDKNIIIKKLNFDNNVLVIEVSKKYNGIIAKKNYDIKLTFKAYIENDNIVIKGE